MKKNSFFNYSIKDRELQFLKLLQVELFLTWSPSFLVDITHLGSRATKSRWPPKTLFICTHVRFHVVVSFDLWYGYLSFWWHCVEWSGTITHYQPMRKFRKRWSWSLVIDPYNNGNKPLVIGHLSLV